MLRRGIRACRQVIRRLRPHKEAEAQVAEVSELQPEPERDPRDVFPLSDLMDPLPLIKVIDVGAMWYNEGAVPYYPLLNEELAVIVGFEPQEDECRKLNEMFPSPHVHFPYSIGDGTNRNLNVCNVPLATSLYEPNTSIVKLFNELSDVAIMFDKVPVETMRLDDIPEARNADFLKIDVQGAELDVLKGATEVLSTALVVHAEVEFIPLYKAQPLFADVDEAMRAAGYSLFTLEPVQSRAYIPFSEEHAALFKSKQALWTDAVYVKSLFDLEKIDGDRLLSLVVILHFVYGAFDLCHRLLTHLDHVSGSQIADPYLSKARSWLE